MDVELKPLVKHVPYLEPYVTHLETGMERYGITTYLRASHFLAQIAVESGGFRAVVENLNYRWDKLQPLFGKHRISLDDAMRFGRSTDGSKPAHQNALANILYGGEWGLRNLGNTKPGDGWRFRGRGLKQITGRANYLDISYIMYNDDRLLTRPEILETPSGAALSACAFWHMKYLNPLADADDVRMVTRVVNGGYNGLLGTGGRMWWLRRFKELLQRYG